MEINCFYNETERFPSRPYIKDGYPQNITVLVNKTAVFNCPIIIADLEPYVTWIRPINFTGQHNDTAPEGIELKVSRQCSHFHVVKGILAQT